MKKILIVIMTVLALFMGSAALVRLLKENECQHEWDDGEVTTQATCTEKGEKTFTCTECEETKTEELAPLGHVEEVIPEVPATCTENGTTESKYCKTCEEVFVAPEVIPATGHNFVDGACGCGTLKKYTVTFKNINGDVLCSREVEHGTTPTCEVPIYTDESYVYTFAGWDKQVVPATEDVTYTATFTKTRNNVVVNEDGSYTVPAGYAAKAGTTFATLGAENSVFEFTVNTTKATGWKSFVLAFVTVPEGQAAPVELNTGADNTNTLYSYTRINFALCDGQIFCGYNKNATYGGDLSSGTALMEKYAAVNEGEPIAIDFKVVYAPGLFECWVDGELYFAYGSEYEPLREVGADAPVVDVINNHTGSTALGFGPYATPCPVDVTVSNIKVSEYIKHEHNWNVLEEVLPENCESYGHRTYVCECGDNYEEVIRGEHDITEISAEQPATCENNGYTAMYGCNLCGGEMTGGEEILALGHEYGENGTCLRCGCVVDCTEHEFVEGFCNNCGMDKLEYVYTSCNWIDLYGPVTIREGKIIRVSADYVEENAVDGMFKFSLSQDNSSYSEYGMTAPFECSLSLDTLTLMDIDDVAVGHPSGEDYTCALNNDFIRVIKSADGLYYLWEVKEINMTLTNTDDGSTLTPNFKLVLDNYSVFDEPMI